MTEEGYIQPEESCLKQMLFRKPGLPILMVEFPDGKKVPYWNTFYQEVHGRQYLGQMDVNIQSVSADAPLLCLLRGTFQKDGQIHTM